MLIVVHMSRDVRAGGGETVLEYLRAYERVLRDQKLAIHFDPEAHFRVSSS